MIDRVDTQIAVSVGNANKKAANALERVTDRLAGSTGGGVDQAVSLRLSGEYSENYLKARNIQNDISYYQSREQTLGSVADSLHQLRDLAVKIGSPALSESDKSIIYQEADMLMQDIGSMVQSAEFNSLKTADDISLESLGLDKLSMSSGSALGVIDSAISTVTSKQAETGANLAALDARIDNYMNRVINLAMAIEARSGSLAEDITNLAEMVNRAEMTVQAADVMYDLDREKVKSLLDMM